VTLKSHTKFNALSENLQLCSSSKVCFLVFTCHPAHLLSFRPLILHARYLSNLPQNTRKELGVKETIQNDIKHAEALGVLAPPAPDANGFRKLIHSTIELTVRSVYLFIVSLAYSLPGRNFTFAAQNGSIHVGKKYLPSRVE